MQYLHQYGEEYKETGYQQCGIVVYPLLVFRVMNELSFSPFISMK